MVLEPGADTVNRPATVPGMPILQSVALEKEYRPTSLIRGAVTHALAGVSVVISKGISIGVAGESGSGKSTLVRLLLGLEEPTGGTVLFRGQSLGSLGKQDLGRYRGAVQAVFQDPASALSPKQRIWQAITEPAWIARNLSNSERKKLATSLLESIGLGSASADKYPHQFSGGERQRICVARALSSNPEVVLLDEPVASLDASMRAQAINLLRAEARGTETTYVVISHDLVPIFHLTEYLYIMYNGLVVEEGTTPHVIEAPRHPYTRALVAAAVDPLAAAQDDVAPAASGCPFATRCPYAAAACSALPAFFDTPGEERGHRARCHIYNPDPEISAAFRRETFV